MNHDRRPGSRSEGRRVLFFGLTTWVVAAVLGVVMIGATLVGLLLGRRIGRSGDTVREPGGAGGAAPRPAVGPCRRHVPGAARRRSGSAHRLHGAGPRLRPEPGA